MDTEPLAELFPDAAQHRFDRRRGRATTALLTVTLLLGALLAGVVAVPALAAGAAGNLALRVWEALPSELAVDRSLPQHLVLLDSTGVEFARVFEQNRSEVTLDQVAPVMVDALIATEDHRFFDHHGLDFTGLTRAAWSNLTGGSTQGASTITQQLVQNILISTATTDEERLVAEGTSLQAKLREARYALAMEKRLSKEDILTGYLNAVYFGNGAYGIAAAARTYFNTTPDQLTLAQSATLVAVLKNPTRFDPISSVEEATKRRNHIITRMSGLGRVDDDVAAAAIAEPVTVTAGATTSGCAASTHPHYCALVLDEIRTNAAFGATPEARADTLRRGGLTITTALDRTITDIATNTVTAALGPDNRVAAGAAVVQPGTGRILAVAQNHAWDRTQLVYANTAHQPGSVFKPVVSAAAAEAGVPLSTRLASNGPYTPANLDSPGGFNNSGGARHGTLNGARALAVSTNVYFVRLAERIGVKTVADMAERFRLPIPKVTGREAAIALGVYEMTPIQVANIYATIAADGIVCTPTAIISAVTSDGVPVPVSDPDCERLLTPQVAAAIGSALTQTLTNGTMSGVGRLPGRDAGGKTGTTDNNADVWAAGMTRQMATAIWVGDPNGSVANPLHNITVNGRRVYLAYGSSVAAPMWSQIMRTAHVGLPSAPFPAGDLGATGRGHQPNAETRAPDLVGLSVESATVVGEAAGFTIEVSGNGTVTSQSPAAGAPTRPGATITVEASQ